MPGWEVVRELVPLAQVEAVHHRFDAIAQRGARVGDNWVPTDGMRFPRVHQAHDVDALVRSIMVSPRVHDVLVAAMGDEPLAVQTMFYFKPPGARGEMLHQDSRYFLCEPRPCVGVWIAIDASSEDNGGLAMPADRDRTFDLLPITADADARLNGSERAGYEGQLVVPELDPGDAAVFDGLVPHGSGPNTHATRWRRSLVMHYVPKSTRTLAKWYGVVRSFDGAIVDIRRVSAR